MLLVMSLGFWIAFGPSSRPGFALRDGAVARDVRIGEERGVLEGVTEPDGSQTFRLMFRDQPATRVMSRAEMEALLGPRVVAGALQARGNWFFRTLNVTSWAGVMWVGLGLLGQALFSGRMVLQWLVSERQSKSVITESFWWFSLLGGLILFTYFVWRQDPVAMLGQASGIVIYSRNLRLIYKQKRRARRDSGAEPGPDAGR
jgi:lipid-A-disaccharide synthase-like uncharacterized protein